MRPLSFRCETDTLFGALHAGGGATGLIVISGGLQTRAGPHRLFVAIAETVSAAGHPVLRFDRRGVGDSDGEDPGFEGSGPDIAAAVQALKAAAPGVRHVVGLGLCDGASALALYGRESGIDALALLNPWTSDEAQAPELPPELLRARYGRRLLNPTTWRRLLSGDIDIAGALRALFAPAPAATALAGRIQAALAAFPGPVLALLSEADATAGLFEPLARQSPGMACRRFPGADHTLTRPADRAAALEALLEFMRRARRPAPGAGRR